MYSSYFIFTRIHEVGYFILSLQKRKLMLREVKGLAQSCPAWRDHLHISKHRQVTEVYSWRVSRVTVFQSCQWHSWDSSGELKTRTGKQTNSNGQLWPALREKNSGAWERENMCRAGSNMYCTLGGQKRLWGWDPRIEGEPELGEQHMQRSWDS